LDSLILLNDYAKSPEANNLLCSTFKFSKHCFNKINKHLPGLGESPSYQVSVKAMIAISKADSS